MVVGALVVAGGLGVYLARLSIARDVLTGWLADRGVKADLTFDTFGLGGLSGVLRVGPPGAPVLSADKVEVGYGFGGFWSNEPFGLQVRSVRLVRPILHATWTGERLTFGALDRIIDEFRRKPPNPDQPQPAVRIEDGLLLLASDYGALQVRADATIDNGKLSSLDARSSPGRLQAGEDFAALGPGGLTVRTRDGRLDVLFQVYVAELHTTTAAAKGVNVRLAGQAPYPDMIAQSAAGPVALRLILSGAELEGQGGRLSDARVEARFDGRAKGWLNDLALDGAGQAEVAAEGGAAGPARGRKLRLKFDLPQLAWTRKGGDRVAGRYDVVLQATELTQADLRLRDAQAAFQGSGAAGAQGGELQAQGAISARGAWTGLGPPAAADDPETAALKRALVDFNLAAPSLALNIDHDRLAISLPAPAIIRTRSGGLASLSAIGRQPLYDGGAGRFQVTTKGGGLPAVQLAVDRFAVDAGVVTASASLTAQGSLGPVHEGVLATRGALRAADGGLTYVARDCATLSAAQLRLGENDVAKPQAQACPVAGAPLLALANGETRIRTQLRAASADVEFLQTRITAASGAVDVAVRDRGPTGLVRLDSAKLDDLAPARRFYPLTASGPIKLDGDLVRADIDLKDAAGRHLARAVVDQDLAKGRGGAQIDTGNLVFTQGGLQPAELSPLAALIASPVEGQAAFTGALAWTAAGLTSQGVLKVAHLDFKSPAGAVSGVSGDLTFNSLVPLTAAPGQRLTAQRVDMLGAVTNADVTFGLDAGALYIEGAKAQVGGGTVKLEKFDLPFDTTKPWSGAMDIDAVQVADLVKASPFGDKMSLQAKLSGRLPFTVSPEGIRIAGGELHAVEPGVLSIQREALTGVEAQSGVAVEVPGVPSAKPPAAGDNLVADFAYQALEHLAFEKLAAEVDSRPEGRLGVMFWIKGEFRPPQHQEIRLGYLEAIKGSYMDKKLPLPSNTKVDLALDTSVNLDQLLADYAEYQKLRGSGPVQP